MIHTNALNNILFFILLDIIMLILSNPIHSQKGQIYNVLHKWLQDGLLTSCGQKWQNRRKLLTPAFHFKILQQCIVIFNEESEKFVKTLKREARINPIIDVTIHSPIFTLKTITETTIGTKLKFHTQKDREYKQAVFDIGQIVIYKMLHPWCFEYIGNFFNSYYFKERQVVKVLHDFTEKLIRKHEKMFKTTQLQKEKQPTMLDLMFLAKRDGYLIDDNGIQEEVDTFTFEGHDTTAVAINFSLMLIACHKTVQDLLVQEINEVLGNKNMPTCQDLQCLKYMERVIKECLRLYPSVPLIARTLGKAVTTYSGYVLPKETLTFLHIFDLHRNANIFPDPEKFDPDRFLPENTFDRHSFAYLPFSAGSRNCIGQKFAIFELKSVLYAVLRNFALEAVDTPDTIELVVDMVLRTKNGIRIKFLPRTLTYQM